MGLCWMSDELVQFGITVALHIESYKLNIVYDIGAYKLLYISLAKHRLSYNIHLKHLIFT